MALIVPHLSSPWESQEIDLLVGRLQDNGFGALLLKTRPDFTLDQQLLGYLRGFNPDAAICFVENVTPRMLRPALGRAMPIYVTYPEAVRSDDIERNADCLAVHHRVAYEQALALVIATGAESIAFLGGREESLATRSRQATLQHLLAGRAGVSLRVCYGQYTYEGGFRAALHLFRVEGGVDAIISANDMMAFGAIDALRHELGLSVPGDVSVLGYDDVPQAAWHGYDLSTLQVNLEDRVECLTRLVLRRLAHPREAPMIETVAARFIAWRTIGGLRRP